MRPTRTYWDCVRLRFPRREGMRIDREERKGKGASDHAPVVVDLAD